MRTTAATTATLLVAADTSRSRLRLRNTSQNAVAEVAQNSSLIVGGDTNVEIRPHDVMVIELPAAAVAWYVVSNSGAVVDVEASY
jgi:hypothetical protein